MMILDVDGTFEKLDKLRARMMRLEKHPNSDEWQYTRLLIRALTECVSKAKKTSAPGSRKISIHAPEAVRGDWQELVAVLMMKGIKPDRRKNIPKDE
jgi:hypothetical protein